MLRQTQYLLFDGCEPWRPRRGLDAFAGCRRPLRGCGFRSIEFLAEVLQRLLVLGENPGPVFCRELGERLPQDLDGRLTFRCRWPAN